ncbi:MAG TPA: rhodanese-like domain-containing protein [Gammaproteobacteria bacterium]
MQQFFEFALRHWDLFLALFMILAMMFGGGVVRRLRGFQETDALSAVQLINHDNALLLDVREESEFREGHILNARHIPLGTLQKRLGELEPFKDKPVLVYCRSGHRSASACGALRRHGFQSVTNLKGGIMAWQNAGMPVSKGNDGKKRKK